VNNKNIAFSPQETRRGLTLLHTLTKQLANDLYYASDPATRRYWSGYQQACSARSIKRKKAESLELIAALPAGFDKQLLKATLDIWRAFWTFEPDDPGKIPSWGLVRRQAKLIAEIRSALAPPKSRRRVAA
jgi:hypothetical protein